MRTLEKKTDLKKEKKKLSKEDETKMIVIYIVKHLRSLRRGIKRVKKKKKFEMTFMTLGRGRNEVSRKVFPL